MHPTLQDMLRDATRLTRSGQLKEATAAIQRALAGATAQAPPAVGPVLDGLVFETDSPNGPVTDPQHDTGEFISGTHTHASLTRRYKLYVPPGHAGRALPLVLMLHGCTQDPDDFAVGTGMNEHAREQGFFVLYPAQAQDANPSRCWNWFKHNHQRRDSGEPAVLADMARAVLRQYGLDPRRVYVAGLSAGGAMAAILAALYPDVFAAVGVHSGLANGAASNLPQAMAAMKGGASAGGARGLFGAGPAPAPGAQNQVPTIVFHGDQDRTVHPLNGEQVISAAVNGRTLVSAAEQAKPQDGRPYTRTVHRDADGNAMAEHWLVHGAGHAWSGGRAQGSYTDPEGPDASAEMLRFFFAQPVQPAQ